MTIEVDGLVHAYGDLVALDGVSFRVGDGEVFGYLGPNGAGKSTTVRILLGLQTPRAGRAWVAGVDVLRDPVTARERVGYLPELIAVYEGLTPLEHLDFVARVRRLPEDVAARRMRALFEAFDIGDRVHEPMRGYSKGMRQKIGIALALLHRPDVLILDEPQSGLDAGASLVLKELIKGFAARGAAVLYCSHVLDVVERVCDRALILNRGRVAAEGTIDELRSRAAGTTLEEVFRSVAELEDPAVRAARALAELYS